MNNTEKYDQIMRESFELDESFDVTTLVYQGVEKWDSVGHMTMVAMLEETFDIMMDTDDIIDFSSYEKGKEILGKYGIEF
ncbi:MAG: acyl carrier protein [Clostridiales bacterium]|nr:acyl carrier protein [Clostridiales bacterium]MBO4578782.1 acyl carrier protein [Clostridiales bacterium]